MHMVGFRIVHKVSLGLVHLFLGWDLVWDRACFGLGHRVGFGIMYRVGSGLVHKVGFGLRSYGGLGVRAYVGGWFRA